MHPELDASLPCYVLMAHSCRGSKICSCMHHTGALPVTRDFAQSPRACSSDHVVSWRCGGFERVLARAMFVGCPYSHDDAGHDLVRLTAADGRSELLWQNCGRGPVRARTKIACRTCHGPLQVCIYHSAPAESGRNPHRPHDRKHSPHLRLTFMMLRCFCPVCTSLRPGPSPRLFLQVCNSSRTARTLCPSDTDQVALTRSHQQCVVMRVQRAALLCPSVLTSATAGCATPSACKYMRAPDTVRARSARRVEACIGV